MSVHDKMNADYVWIRNAPVEEGLKVRYFYPHAETMATTSCMIAPPTESKDLK
jgi:hypothetical protein